MSYRRPAMKRRRTMMTRRRRPAKRRRLTKAQGYNSLQRVLTSFWDKNTNVGVSTTPGLVNLLAGLGTGAGPTGYQGVSITPIALTIRLMAYCTTSVSFQRFIVFQSLSSAVPVAGDILQSGLGSLVVAPIRHIAKDDFLILRDILMSGTQSLNGQPAGMEDYKGHAKIYIKGKKMCKISGVDSGALTNGCIYILSVADALAGGSHNFTARLEFRSNSS